MESTLPQMLHPLVDFHCHLDLYPDYKAAFEACRSEEIEVLAVTTTPRAWERNTELASGRKHIRVALGLHPQLIADGHDELAAFEKLLPKARYIGEVGLDAGPRFYKSMEKQRQAFERVLRCCREHGDKIISIHAVRTVKDVLGLIEAQLPPGTGKAVFHWFTGSKSEAKRAVDLGCYFSINAEMLKGDSGRSVVTSIPRDRLLTETDGPFTKIDGHPTKPLDVSKTVESLASLLALEAEVLRKQIHLNLLRLESTEL